MKNDSRPIIDLYLNRVFKSLMICIPTVALFAGITFTVIKLLGLYPNTPLGLIIGFDMSTIIYLLIGFIFLFKCEDKEKVLKPKAVILGKIVIAIIIVTQWNFITYMVPVREFWAYSSLFIAVVIFLCDHKYTAIVIGEVLISIVISWIVKPDILLPVQDELFIPNMILRVVLIILLSFFMWLTTYLIENVLVKELSKVAEFDTLTMLGNRRALSHYLDREIAHCKKTNNSFCLFLCDIDDFKNVNDTYGHDCGDLVLKNLADTLSFSIGSDGRVFRYGGEEIVLIINHKKDLAVEMAEEILTRVREMNTQFRGHNIKITLTMGMSVFTSDLEEKELIIAADKLLYYGKKHGKNQLVY